MSHTDVTYIAVLDADTSSSRSLIESSTHLMTKIFSDIHTLSLSSDTVSAVFIDTDFVDQNILTVELHRIKDKWPTSPLIAMIGDLKPDSVMELFRVGMDDFLLKPINKDELALRMLVKQAQFSREKSGVIAAEDLSVDPNTRSIKNLVTNKIKYVSPIEVSLLTLLMRSLGQAISRDVVKRKCWGTTTVSDNALNRKLFEVRKALSQIGSELTIKTLYGSGYAIQKRKPTPLP